MVRVSSTSNLRLAMLSDNSDNVNGADNGSSVKTGADSAPSIAMNDLTAENKSANEGDEEEENILLDEDAILALSDSDDDSDEPSLLQTIAEGDEDGREVAEIRRKKSKATNRDAERKTPEVPKVIVTPEDAPRVSAFTVVSGSAFRPIVPNSSVTDSAIAGVDNYRMAGLLPGSEKDQRRFQVVVGEHKQRREKVNGVGLGAGDNGRVASFRVRNKDSLHSQGIMDSDSSLVVRRHSFAGTAKSEKSLSDLRVYLNRGERRSSQGWAAEKYGSRCRAPLIMVERTSSSSSDSESEETKTELSIAFSPTKNAVHRTGLRALGRANSHATPSGLSVSKTNKVARRYSIGHTREAHLRSLENFRREDIPFLKARKEEYRNLSHQQNTQNSRQRRHATIEPPKSSLLLPPSLPKTESPTTHHGRTPLGQVDPTTMQRLNVDEKPRRASSIIPPRRDATYGTTLGVVDTSAEEKRRASCPAASLSSSYFMLGDDNWDDGKSFDHYLMTMHLMTNPGESEKVRQLLQPLIDLIIPKLKIFNIVERGLAENPDSQEIGIHGTTPSTGVVLFLQEDFGMDRILNAQKYFQQRPWQLHHRDRLGTNIVSLPSNNQDFYLFSLDMPLWGVRQVHGGRDNLRFMVFVSDENWEDTIHLYTTLLKKEVRLNRNGFSYFTVFRDNTIKLEIQLALKRLPKGLKPRVSESSMLQFKVEEIGQMVPLLPHSCTPISERRWQTTDYDGNRILLLVAPIKRCSQDVVQLGVPTKKTPRHAGSHRVSVTSISSAYESASESWPQSKRSTSPSSLSSHSYHSVSENSVKTDSSDDDNVMYI
ncbi:uncharacterized protein [Ptychodera flava]|uniref:uncharacterized protein n=1 Tax=Ptychodera flava TaxID=63121 RepID=UPI00396A1388